LLARWEINSEKKEKNTYLGVIKYLNGDCSYKIGSASSWLLAWVWPLSWLFALSYSYISFFPNSDLFSDRPHQSCCIWLFLITVGIPAVP
jgi:hypothetical protein